MFAPTLMISHYESFIVDLLTAESTDHFPMRVLSGIQPTGRFHWGNYFGAIRQYIALQNEDQAVYFIANLHALTTVRDPELLRAAHA